MTEFVESREKGVPIESSSFRETFKQTLRAMGLLASSVTVFLVADQFTAPKRVNLETKPTMIGDVINLNSTINACDTKKVTLKKHYQGIRNDYLKLLTVYNYTSEKTIKTLLQIGYTEEALTKAGIYDMAEKIKKSIAQLSRDQ